jgi:hypothetical protein
VIISASRRTDIPAFYSEWFMNRIQAGYCTVPNPFNRKQVSRVSLRPEDVDVIVFWTRHPRPLLPHLAALDERGYRYYFQYTLMNNPRAIDPKTPPLEASLRTFRELADRIGPAKVIWRYDPIVFTKAMGAGFHQQAFERIARALQGYTHRSVISVVDVYRKASKRLREMAAQGHELIDYDGSPSERFDELMRALVRAATDSGMEIVSCAEDVDLRPFGVRPGKCVDDEYISRVFGITVTSTKDPAQRQACGCVVSKDIGMYDTCLYGCRYCYATSSFERARENHGNHDPSSPSLMGWYEAEPVSGSDEQLTLISGDELLYLIPWLPVTGPMISW